MKLLLAEVLAVHERHPNRHQGLAVIRATAKDGNDDILQALELEAQAMYRTTVLIIAILFVLPGVGVAQNDQGDDSTGCHSHSLPWLQRTAVNPGICRQRAGWLSAQALYLAGPHDNVARSARLSSEDSQVLQAADAMR